MSSHFNPAVKESATAVFCQKCGTILDIGTATSCPCCDASIPIIDNKDYKIVTHASIRTQTILKEVEAEIQRESRAVVDETCPKCAFGKCYYSVAQLRSADEGSTCFYNCLKCKHNWSVNN